MPRPAPHPASQTPLVMHNVAHLHVRVRMISVPFAASPPRVVVDKCKVTERLRGPHQIQWPHVWAFAIHSTGRSSIEVRLRYFEMERRGMVTRVAIAMSRSRLCAF